MIRSETPSLLAGRSRIKPKWTDEVFMLTPAGVKLNNVIDISPEAVRARPKH